MTFRIQLTVQLIDNDTEEVAKSHHGNHPIEWKSSFFPLFVDSRDGHEATNALYEAAVKVMHLGSSFYRTGVNQGDK